MATALEKTSAALCILHGVQKPLRVEILEGDFKSINENTKTKIIQLKRDDMSTVRLEHTKLVYQTCHKIMVPEQCLISPISYKKVPSTTKYNILGDFYHMVEMENVEKTDMVAWTPHLLLDRTEIIACTLQFTGYNVLQPGKVIAFVSPLQFFNETTLQSTGSKISGQVPGWGKVFKVPLADVYRWHDIIEMGRRIKTELKFDKLQWREEFLVAEEKFHEFVFTKIQSTGENGENYANSNNLCSLELSDDEDDISKISGDTAKKVEQIFLQDDSPKESRSYDFAEKDKRESEIVKTILYGKCFAEQGKFQKTFVDDIRSGDVIVASPKDGDVVLGHVGLICKIPALKQNQIFVGVNFEESINRDPFEVRHEWGPECPDENCMQARYVFIPLELLINSDPLSEKHLRILEDTPTPRTIRPRDTLKTSDIHVDFRYESNRQKFGPLSLGFNK